MQGVGVGAVGGAVGERPEGPEVAFFWMRDWGEADAAGGAGGGEVAGGLAGGLVLIGGCRVRAGSWMDIGLWRSGTATGEHGFLGRGRLVFRRDRWFLAAGAGYREREFIDLKGLCSPSLLLVTVQGGCDLTERLSLEASFRREAEGVGAVPDRFFPMKLFYSGKAAREWMFLVSSAAFSRSLHIESDGGWLKKDIWEGKISRLSGRIAGLEAKGFIEGKWAREEKATEVSLDVASTASALIGGSLGGADFLLSGRARWSGDWSWNGAAELFFPDGSLEARLEYSGPDDISLRLECRFSALLK